MAAKLATLFVCLFVLLQPLLGQGYFPQGCEYFNANHINSLFIFTVRPIVVIWGIAFKSYTIIKVFIFLILFFFKMVSQCLFLYLV